MASEEWMIIDSEKKTSELKLNQPKPFTGKWTEFNKFLQDIKLYLDINEDIYNTNKKKIRYALSFMNEGDTKSWKGQFIWNAQGPAGLDLGTWMQFVKELKNAFQPCDAPGDTLEHLTNIKMGSNTIEDHTSWFQTLLEKSGVSKNFPLAINYYWKTLNVPLQKEILELPVTPKTLEEWYEWAMRLDNNYHKMMRIMGRGIEKKKSNNNGKRLMFP